MSTGRSTKTSDREKNLILKVASRGNIIFNASKDKNVFGRLYFVPLHFLKGHFCVMMNWSNQGLTLVSNLIQ